MVLDSQLNATPREAPGKPPGSFPGSQGRKSVHEKKYFLGSLPVLKLTTISMRKMVSDRQLNATHRVERSSLKKEMATGRMIRLATSNNSMHKSQ